MARVIIDRLNYENALKTIEKYLNDIYVNDKAELDGIFYAEDLLSDILLDLDVEKEE